MALAPYFDKAALAAAEVLQHYDRGGFEGALQDAVIGLAFDSAATSRPDGRQALDLTANLLSRLYPRLALVPLDARAAMHRVAIEGVIRSINPDIELLDNFNAVRACVAIGETSVEASVPIVYLGANGWVARISMRSPLGTAGSVNPFGAGAAACLAAARVFRVVFGSQLGPQQISEEEELCLSLLDLHPGSSEPLNPAWVRADLGESVLVGLGAIGNGAVWALARAPDLFGVLHLVDPEVVDATNPQRYVLTTLADIGKLKVQMAAEHLAATSIDVRMHPQTWGQFLTERGDWLLQRVAVAVDSAAARQAIQAALPKWVVNAWTQPGDLGLSRHGFVGDEACLMCLYLPDRPRPHLSQLVAEAIGFSAEYGAPPERQVRDLLASGRPVGREFLAQVAQRRGIALDALLAWENQPLRSFYAEAVCGGVVLALGGGQPDGGAARAHVPMAFQSAFAGILLAAHLVAEAAGIEVPVSTKASINVLTPLGRLPLSRPHRKPATGRCICQDRDYIAAYERKYGTTAA